MLTRTPLRTLCAGLIFISQLRGDIKLQQRALGGSRAVRVLIVCDAREFRVSGEGSGCHVTEFGVWGVG